jgi:hypothetical protein
MKPTRVGPSVTAGQRQKIAEQYEQTRKAYCLAVVDDLAAYIRAIRPQAAYVAFALYGDRSTSLLGILGAQPSPPGNGSWLWDVTAGDEHPLTAVRDALTVDLDDALGRVRSPLWPMVSPHGPVEDNCWLLELPPPDRAARIAELVREHHPSATAAVTDVRMAGGRVIEIIDNPIPAGGQAHQATKPRWPSQADDEITRLAAHMWALPDARARYFTPVGDDYVHPYGYPPSDLVRRLNLPPAP